MSDTATSEHLFDFRFYRHTRNFHLLKIITGIYMSWTTLMLVGTVYGDRYTVYATMFNR